MSLGHFGITGVIPMPSGLKGYNLNGYFRLKGLDFDMLSIKERESFKLIEELIIAAKLEHMAQCTTPDNCPANHDKALDMLDEIRSDYERKRGALRKIERGYPFPEDLFGDDRQKRLRRKDMQKIASEGLSEGVLK